MGQYVLENYYPFSRMIDTHKSISHGGASELILIQILKLFNTFFPCKRNHLQTGCITSINIRRMKIDLISDFCSIQNILSTSKHHNFFNWSSFSVLLMFLKRYLSLVSNGTGFISIRFSVCEICSKYRRLFLTVTLFFVSTCKIHQ